MRAVCDLGQVNAGDATASASSSPPRPLPPRWSRPSSVASTSSARTSSSAVRRSRRGSLGRGGTRCRRRTGDRRRVGVDPRSGGLEWRGPGPARDRAILGVVVARAGRAATNRAAGGAAAASRGVRARSGLQHLGWYREGHSRCAPAQGLDANRGQAPRDDRTRSVRSRNLLVYSRRRWLLVHWRYLAHGFTARMMMLNSERSGRRESRLARRTPVGQVGSQPG